jgi:hypothetical protein
MGDHRTFERIDHRTPIRPRLAALAGIDRRAEPLSGQPAPSGGQSRPGFVFSTIPVWPWAATSPDPRSTIAAARAAESGIPEAPIPDDEHRLAQAPGLDAGVAADAGSAAPTLSASISVTGNGSYTDTATSSTKPVKFNVTWSGGAKEDYIIVNWIKGFMKNSSGTPYKVTMFGASVDYDFADWRVDSLDKDPAYWSSGGVRWNYTVDAASKFSATDGPGPMNDSDGKGAEAKVDFKTAVYKSADVGTNVAGPTIAATPLSSFDTWNYHVEVLGGGKFKHT